MRLAASASNCGKPICTALKPKISAVRLSRHCCSHARTYRPAGVCNQPSSAIMDFSDATLSIQFSLLPMIHSPEQTLSPALSVLAVPAFADNYLWLIHDGTHAAVVDPGDAMVILDALKAHQLTLCAILLTHHHADHTGGVPELLQHFAVPVFGPRNEAITAITEPLAEGDVAYVRELGLQLTVIDVPGHTKGHIAY